MWPETQAQHPDYALEERKEGKKDVLRELQACESDEETEWPFRDAHDFPTGQSLWTLEGKKRRKGREKYVETRAGGKRGMEG